MADEQSRSDIEKAENSMDTASTHDVAAAEQYFYGESNPDSLLRDFRGRPLFLILFLTLLIHLFLVGLFSIGYLSEKVGELRKEFFGDGSTELTEDQRLDEALKEATASLREIAKRHDVSPQDLSERFSGESPAATDAGEEQFVSADEPEVPDSKDPGSQDPPSAIERELEETENGPKLPDLPGLEGEDDLFGDPK
jgi:hypothetical protein